jgi:hypothetical protein
LGAGDDLAIGTGGDAVASGQGFEWGQGVQATGQDGETGFTLDAALLQDSGKAIIQGC